ncbi:hypothetical protein ACQKDD_03720 [Planococcus kocurii]|uniref:hypothetical protein n=1 Tax=Planococcus TaxID=1372 RepID=UPI0011EE1E53|nr:hypothetical protein [Planococcus sp. ANT_H30]KAA0957385.1 hypothetical protein FQ085_09770 [Planococcus sp. ANT_H30]
MDEKWLMSIPTDAFRGHGLSRSKTKKGYKKSSISVKWELPHHHWRKDDFDVQSEDYFPNDNPEQTVFPRARLVVIPMIKSRIV